MKSYLVIPACALVLTAAAAGPHLLAQDQASERGRTALTTRAFNPASWSFKAYTDAWKHWQPALKEAPADYDQSFRDYYGLHPAPFENGRYPMGLREGKVPLLGTKGLTTDCMICHGGSILGKSYVGLGNSALDVQSFFQDMGKAHGGSGKTPFTFSNVRGTSEAIGMSLFLTSYRDPDLSVRTTRHDLAVRDDLCEDVPAWWLLKKKKTMYHTGNIPAQSVRSLMQFMLTPTNAAAMFHREEATFEDIQAYLFSLEAPKYPFPVDQALAMKGEALFNKSCARCHGTYGDKWTYPSKIVPLDVVGTDPVRLSGFGPAAVRFFNESWFGRNRDGAPAHQATEATGYQAPPLDGVWATAPYFHNGSVPTLQDVLHSPGRPKLFTRSFTTGDADYDRVKVGWKITTLEVPPDANLPAHERRKVYDTTQPGRGNQGHTFGDAFTDEERRAVIEYLKTL